MLLRVHQPAPILESLRQLLEDGGDLFDIRIGRSAIGELIPDLTVTVGQSANLVLVGEAGGLAKAPGEVVEALREVEGDTPGPVTHLEFDGIGNSGSV